MMKNADGGLAHRLFRSVLLIALLLLAWRLSHILLLIFAGLLFAVFLRYSALGLHKRLGLPICTIATG